MNLNSKSNTTYKIQDTKYYNIIQHLTKWFAKNKRDLPWRKDSITMYEVWVSEVMLQQTQVSRVIPFYTRFIQRFPNIQTLAKTDWRGFLPYYQGLGYYRRGRNMLQTARIIVQKYNEKFPTTHKELLQLPGIGEYTTNALLSFGLNEDVLAFDTNHQRFWGRVIYGNKKSTFEKKDIEKNLQIIFKKKDSIDDVGRHWDFKTLNAAIMDFANLICTNTNPKCKQCPLQKICRYEKTQGKEEQNTLVHKSAFPTKDAQTFLILHKNHKKYFSVEKDKYKPHILKTPLNTRQRIKNFFKRKYDLDLSIRPPFKKTWIQNKPTLFTYAQILLGDHNFTPYNKKAYTTWLKKWMKKT